MLVCYQFILFSEFSFSEFQHIFHWNISSTRLEPVAATYSQVSHFMSILFSRFHSTVIPHNLWTYPPIFNGEDRDQADFHLDSKSDKGIQTLPTANCLLRKTVISTKFYDFSNFFPLSKSTKNIFLWFHKFASNTQRKNDFWIVFHLIARSPRESREAFLSKVYFELARMEIF